MTPGLDAYLSRLRRELRRRWIDDERLIEEAREHLVDRIDDGMKRGLSHQAAEHEAFRGFGLPEQVAECAAEERYPMWRHWAFLVVAWEHKWWIVAPTIASAVAAILVAPYVAPVRYEAESLLEFTPVTPESTQQRDANVLRLGYAVTSQPNLERVIKDLNLYENEQRQESIASIARQMRGDISVIAQTTDLATNARTFTVRFAASDPNVATQGTQRLASLFVQENLRLATGSMSSNQNSLETMGRLRIVNPATVPTDPVRPDPARSVAIGGFGGLLLGIAFVAFSRRRNRA